MAAVKFEPRPGILVSSLCHPVSSDSEDGKGGWLSAGAGGFCSLPLVRPSRPIDCRSVCIHCRELVEQGLDIGVSSAHRCSCD